MAHPSSWWKSAESSFLTDKVARCETNHSPPSSVEVKNIWSYTSAHSHAFMARTGTKLLCFYRHTKKSPAIVFAVFHSWFSFLFGILNQTHFVRLILFLFQSIIILLWLNLFIKIIKCLIITYIHIYILCCINIFTLTLRNGSTNIAKKARTYSTCFSSR